MSNKVSGNQCMFFLFGLVNLLLLLESLAVIGLGIYLWVEIGSFEVFCMVFIGLGCVELLLSYVGWTAKKSSAKLTCYIWFLGIVFIAQTTATVLGIIMKDDIIDRAAAHSHSEKSAEQIKKLMEEHVDACVYGTISAVVIQLICLLFSICYRSSLRGRQTDQYHNLESEERKTSLQNQQTAINQKYESKRQHYRDKYNY